MLSAKKIEYKLPSGTVVSIKTGFDEAAANQADYDRQMNDLSELGALAGAELKRLNRQYQKLYPFQPVDDNEQFDEDNAGYFEGVRRAAAKKAAVKAELRETLQHLTPKQIETLSAAVA